MKREISSTGEATYCPEDNKLRLYVGRVPRDEYETLRAEGWTATPKQACNFVATWTPEREDTAKLYGGGVIGDEDQDPGERAAERAERFTGYLDKRTSEAGALADKYEDGPTVHGYQNQERAERAAARHDRQADKAVDMWSKAEYWQRRTAGVISHALYKDLPGVRMGRIKMLEADIRRYEASGRVGRWQEHYALRLAYERQMLEGQGGTAGQKDIEAGGLWKGGLIIRINKSAASGRVTSANVRVKAKNDRGMIYTMPDGHQFAIGWFKIERADPAHYTEPTPESMAELEKTKAAISAGNKAVAPEVIPLVNPTDADAERLQAVWNAQRGKNEPQKTVLRMTQAEYSASSKGSYARVQTVEVTGGGKRPNTAYNAVNFPSVAKVRAAWYQIIVITDKPQKPLPDIVWNDPRPAVIAEVTSRIFELERELNVNDTDKFTEEGRALISKAASVGFAYVSSWSQFGMTDKGHAILEAAKALLVAPGGRGVELARETLQLEQVSA